MRNRSTWQRDCFSLYSIKMEKYKGKKQKQGHKNQK